MPDRAGDGAKSVTRRGWRDPIRTDAQGVTAQAARSEPRVASVWLQVMKGRESAIGQLLDSLTGALRSELTPKRALDLYVTITLPEIFRTLVIERAWSSARYQQWLGDLLIQELLGP